MYQAGFARGDYAHPFHEIYDATRPYPLRLTGDYPLDVHLMGSILN